MSAAPHLGESCEDLCCERDFSAALLERLGAVVVVLDASGRFIRFNRASEVLSGYTLEELRHDPFWEILIPPEELDGVRAVVSDLVENKRPNEWENHWITKSGARRLLHWWNTVLLDDAGGVAAVLSTGIDVTEQRRAEAERDRLLVEERAAREKAQRAERRYTFLEGAVRALNTSFEDYASALRSLARLAVPRIGEWCAVSMIQPRRVLRSMAFAHVDRALEAELLELGLADIEAPIVEGAKWLDGSGLVVCDGDAALPGAAQASLLAGFKGEQLERAKAVLRVMGLSAYMIARLSARGRPLGVMLFGSSAPGYRFEPEARLLAEALAARAALALDNARLYQEAQEAILARDEFLVAASHELLTPCTSMVLGVRALLRRADAGTLSALPSEVQRSALERCDRQANKLVTLVERLLEVARIAVGPLRIERDDVDLGEIAREVGARRAAEAALVGSSITVRADAPALGRWDRGRVEQAISSLVENALKYGAGRPVEVRVDADEAIARVAVEDHGIGIDEPQRQRLFQRFERGVPIERYGGLGLGLYVARAVVEAHGGSIEATSALGRGSTFVIALPRHPAIG